MFTGIIKQLGRVAAIENRADRIISIVHDAPWPDLTKRASVACNGVCLTVIDRADTWFQVQISAETLSKTTVGDWCGGTIINLERALRAGDEMGGHILSGHVDGVAEIIERQPDGESVRFRFRAPEALRRYLAPKGSIALDGVSLTVNDVAADSFGVNIIPHTQLWTNFGTAQPGDKMNMEVDQLARYLDRLLAARGL